MTTQSYLTTKEAAARLLVKPQTLLASLVRRGHYAGIFPKKLPSKRLAWPVADIDRLIPR